MRTIKVRSVLLTSQQQHMKSTTLEDWYMKQRPSSDLDAILAKAEFIQRVGSLVVTLPLHDERVMHLIYFKGWLVDGNNELLIKFTLYRHGAPHVRRLEDISLNGGGKL